MAGNPDAAAEGIIGGFLDADSVAAGRIGNFDFPWAPEEVTGFLDAGEPATLDGGG